MGPRKLVIGKHSTIEDDAMRIFDAHFHIINRNFPIVENQGYLPPSYAVEDYKQDSKYWNITGGAIVSGSFQGFDQGYLLHALEQMGPTFYGVTQLPFRTTDEEILELNEKGVRAVRFNVRRGGSEVLSKLDYMARRIHELAGWHIELYMDAKELHPIANMIAKLPAVSVDHLGLSEEGLPQLLQMVDKGVRVKATGFGRVDLPVPTALVAIYETNPDALMFGTDLPSTRAERPFSYEDIELIHELFDEKAVERILYSNAVNWYSK